MKEEIVLPADRPISGKAEDRLNRGAFSVRLASAIATWNGHESLVIGLYGAWGSGKSSVKNMVLEALRERGDAAPNALEFNPWQWKGHEDVTGAFFRELLRKLEGRDKSAESKKLARDVRAYARFLGIGSAIFDATRTTVGGAVGILGLLALGLPALLTSEATVRLTQLLGGLVLALGALLIWGEAVLDRIARWLEARSATASRSLEEQKQHVAESLRRQAKSMLVVVDDVDRLPASDIRTVFQLIKANADFPKFVYLVLFQRSIIEDALADDTKDQGSKFLEKIVQVGFEIPPARSEDINKVLFEGLDAVLGKDSERIEQTYWGNVYVGGLSHYFANLRDVKRFLGVLSFHGGLLRTDGVLEVNPVDFIALETLSVFEPAFYRELGRRKALFTGRTRRDDRHEKFVEECRGILQFAEDEKRPRLTDLICELFPSVADAFGGMRHGSDFYDEWLRKLRVCSPDIFDRYFEHSLATGDVSLAEIDKLVGLSGNGKALTQEMRRFADDGRLMTALERFELKLDNIPRQEIADVVIAIFNVGEYLPDRLPSALNIPPHWTVMRLVTKLLLKETDAEQREQLLDRAIRESDGITMAVIRIGWDSDPDGRKKAPGNCVIREESLPKFQAQCVERIRKLAAEGVLYDHRDLAHLLYRWRDWTNIEEVREWVRKLVSSEFGALAFLRGFLHAGTSQGFGDHVAKVHWYVKLKETEVFADSEELEGSLANVALVALSEKDRRSVEQFRKALARRRAGKEESDLGWDRNDD